MKTDALGSLLYTADGRFSVMISRAGRTWFDSDDLLGGATEEKARAVEGFVAYAGRYSFHGDRVVHQWSVELSGDRLILSARPLLLAGKQQVPRLVWERVEPLPRGRLIGWPPQEAGNRKVCQVRE
jgi:hypothetical protein